jgi:hypothetical protein
MPRNFIALMTALSLGAAVPAFAADEAPATQTTAATVAPKSGEIIRDANGRKIGVVDSVRGQTVMVITATKMVQVPITTVSVGASGLQTTLKAGELH